MYSVEWVEMEDVSATEVKGRGRDGAGEVLEVEKSELEVLGRSSSSGVDEELRRSDVVVVEVEVEVW